MPVSGLPPYDDNNIFARILRGEIPCTKVYEDEHTIAFMDIMPQADGHTLVVPKNPSVNLLDADAATFGPLFSTVQKIARAVKQGMGADGIVITQFNESAAGQTVFHLHVHIIPRWEGVALRKHSGQMADAAVLKDHAEKIKAATNTLMQTLSAGDHVICGNNTYGGTYRLFEKVWKRHGLEFSFVDCSDLARIEAAITPRTRLIWAETPTNPLMQLADIAAISTLAHARGITVVVDNTFMTPYFQRPLELGADVVMHSVTKYLNGHSDMVGGALITSNAALAEQLRFLQNASGAIPGPMDCFLCLRGTKTLAVRMQRHDENARRGRDRRGRRLLHEPVTRSLV